MRIRDISIGLVVTIVLLIFLVFAVRSCGRSTTTDLPSDLDHLTSCTADRITGLCYPQEKHLDYDHDVFMAMVLVHQKRSSASSSSERSSRRSFRASDSRTSSAFSSSDIDLLPWLRRSDSASGASSTSRSESSSFTSKGSAYSEGRFVRESSGGAMTSGGSTGTGSLRGSVGPLPSGKCLRSRSLLSIFDFGELTTGTDPVTFPVLIDGDCPITAAMIRVRNDGFGGPLDDF